MYKLGITGGIGSGKSTAAEYIKKKGAKIYDADIEAKNIINESDTISNKIVIKFGNSILTNNKIDFEKLSKHIFSSKNNQETLNKIVWPEIFNSIEQSEKNANNEGFPLFIVDAALIFEAGFTNFFNSILLITADEDIRSKRIESRNNFSKKQIQKRMSLQMPEVKKMKLSHFIIENNGSILELYKQLDDFLKLLKMKL